MEEWRLLDLEYANPCMNLAVEEAILRIVGGGIAPSTVRFWRNVNAVVVGYFQGVQSEVNFEMCKKHGTTIARRMTGGGCVYQDLGNLNYSFFLRKDHPLVPKDTLGIFRVVSEAVIWGLNVLGLNAEFKPPNEIQIDGEKVSGMAGRIRWRAVLIHGTLLVNSNLLVMSSVLRVSKRKVTTFKEKIGRKVRISDVKEALKKGFEKTYKIQLVRGKLTKEEEELAKRLYEEKYCKDEWNYWMLEF